VRRATARCDSIACGIAAIVQAINWRNHEMKLIRILILVLAAAIAGCAATETSRSTSDTVDDNVLTARVKTALLQDAMVKGTEVQVETYRGVVQLSGFVDNTEQASRAVSLAEQVPGVASVKNDMRVKPQEATGGQTQTQ
jgi:hyperosmotically inducible periplasmic protein